MQIHNIYADLSFFLSHVVNTILNNKIKQFKYNLGNASFVLNYDPNYELPIAIVNFISLEPFNTRMQTFHRVLSNNTYLVPVLYDRNKDLELQLQEDLYYINFTIDINCESQLHAIELKHNLENFLPVGKLLNYLSFCSFFEVDEIFLNKYLFDVNNDDIDNLFLIHNKLTDDLVYCFSTEYTPLIRLESIDLSIQDITAATFTINTNFKVLTHLPSKIIFNKPLLKDYNSIHLLKHDNIRLPVNDNFDYYLLNNQKLIFVNSDFAAPEYNYIDDINNLVFNIEKHKKYIEYGEFNSIFQNKHITGKLEIHHYENNTINIKINTLIDNLFNNSFLKDIELLPDNKIKALVKYNNNYEEIYLVYSIYKINRLINITEENNNYKVKTYSIIKPNEVYSVIKNINKNKVEINYEETEILGYNDLVFPNSFKLNKNGEFSLNNNIIINGEIDLKSGKSTIYSILNSDLSINNDIVIYYLNINFVFTVFEIRGNGYIEAINFDLTSNSFNNSISTVSVINNDMVDYNKNIKNILIDKINLLENENGRVIFSLFNNLNIEENTSYSFYFTKQNKLISSNSNFVLFKEYLNNHLIFTTSNKFYVEYLETVNNIYPLILKIGI